MRWWWKPRVNLYMYVLGVIYVIFGYTRYLLLRRSALTVPNIGKNNI
jgi:hypothetical protein